MINFKFVKSQFKNIMIASIIFFIILFVLLIPALTQSYLAPAMTFYKHANSSGASYTLGAGVILKNVYFGIPGFIVILTFGIILVHILVSKEIERGYLASWLTTPMSRKTILTSKFFVLICSILIVYLAAFLLQLIFFPIILKDFNRQALADIVIANFALIFLALFWTSINWFIICLFNKASIAISVAAGVSIFFVVACVLSSLANVSSLEKLKFFKYLTITSLLNSPFRFGSLPGLDDPSLPDNGSISAEIFPIKAVDFAWQMPVMFVLPIIIFPVGSLFVVKKDLNL